MYQSQINEIHHELGTSGFLYRSNKLMYDQKTKSMWSTMTGEPVVGELVDQGIRLQRSYVVTTTWKEWLKRHPNTKVLSIETQYFRDYSEGAAYRKYFSTDKLMFNVPSPDYRLKNKAEVVALRNDKEQLAIDAEFLRRNPVYLDKVGGQPVVIFTDASGASRVFDAGSHQFETWDQNDEAADTDGNTWKVGEVSLRRNDTELRRLPAHRAFWFGWHAQFPKTRLIK